MADVKLFSISNCLVIATLSLVCTALIPIIPARAIDINQRAGNSAYLRLVPSKRRVVNRVGNPIYKLEAYLDGRRYKVFKVVTGRSYSQGKNRNRRNSGAPLPDGVYGVSKWIAPGVHREAGRTFVAVYPQFKTKRNNMGIHLDRSYNKRNGEDGTSGCIGLTNRADRDKFNKYVRKYHPRNLIVKISR
jgi:hypothetical protein